VSRSSEKGGDDQFPPEAVKLLSEIDNVVQRCSMLDCTGSLAARMEWSTKPCHSNQPFGNWADILATALVRMEPRKISDDPFEGMISRVDAAPIQISLVKGVKAQAEGRQPVYEGN
jgi:hypothetical protein